MMIQLNPPIPVICPNGKALAHALVDYGIEYDLLWVCFSEQNGECWTFSNREIRGQTNLTLGRKYISPFYDPDDVAFKNEKLVTSKKLYLLGDDFVNFSRKLEEAIIEREKKYLPSFELREMLTILKAMNDLRLKFREIITPEKEFERVDENV